MKKITPEQLQEIRQKADITHIIGQYIPLQKSGNNYKGICPFHDDHDPSLSVNQNLQIYKCFVCGAGGNVFSFVQNFEKISFVEAVVKVAASVGIDLSEHLQYSSNQTIDQKLQTKYDLMEESCTYFSYILKNSLKPEVKEFLAQRELTPDIINHFKIGYNDPSLPVSDYLISKGYLADDCIELNISSDYEGNLRDFFSHRIVFPICDPYDHVIAYTARALEDNTSKYINSSTNSLYQKSDVVYNYFVAKDSQLKDDPVILCEGVMDVIAFYKAGFKKAIATLGTAITPQQVSLIKRLNCEVILAYDGDQAGQKAIYNAGKILKKEQIHVSVINNQTTLDPDEYLKQVGSENFRASVINSIHWMEFIIKYLSSLYPLHSYDSKKTLVSLCLEELKSLDQMDQDYFIQKLSEITDFSVLSLKEQLVSLTSTRKVVPKIHRVYQPKVQKDILQSEKMVIAHLIDSKELCNLYKLKLGYLLNDDMNRLSLMITSLYNQMDVIQIADVLNLQLTPLQKDIILEISTSEIYQFQKSETSLHDAILLIKKEEITKTIQNLHQEIVRTKDDEKKQKLIQTMIQLQIDKDLLTKEENHEKI